MKTAKVINTGTTIVAHVKGKMYMKDFGTNDKVLKAYQDLINANTDSEVISILTEQTNKDILLFEKEAKDKAEKELVKKNEGKIKFKDILSKRYKGKKLFKAKGNQIYMKGIKLSIPFVLAKYIEKCDDSSLEYIINFWKLTAMNPDPRAREDLFEFLKGGKFTITNKGYFVAYRNVLIKSNNKSEETELFKFISKSYLKIKGWKKSTKNYYVVRSSSGYDLMQNGKKLTDSYEYIGNLDVLYNNRDTYKVKEIVYTDAHTRTFTIKIGEIVKMDRSKCSSNPNQDCSYGLHVGNKSFLSKGYFGNEGIAVLVNPSKVVAVPKYNKNKMRVCEYLPIGIVDYDTNGKLIEIDTTEFEHDYCDYDIKEINKMLKKHDYNFEQLKKNELIPYEMDHSTLKEISLSLDEINNKVKNRVVVL